MALLSTRLACGAVLLAPWLASCALSEPLGTAEAWLSVCTDSGGACTSNFAEGDAFVDRSVSRHAPDGVYVYLELEGPDDTLAVLELDVPAQSSDDLEHTIDLSYRELDGDSVLFEADHAVGFLDLPRGWIEGTGTDCRCADISFALRMADPERGGVRKLTSGRAGWGEERCGPTRSFSETATLEVSTAPCDDGVGSDSGGAPNAPARRTSAPLSEEPERSCGCDCGDEDPDVVYVGGCGSYDDGSEDYDGSSGGGCESSSSSDYAGSDATGSASGGGCEGDSSSSDSSGGCEGDSSDAPDACRVAPRRRANSPWLSLGIPLLLACSYLRGRAAWLRRRVTRERGRGGRRRA